jgi:hypothetical protein
VFGFKIKYKFIKIFTNQYKLQAMKKGNFVKWFLILSVAFLTLKTQAQGLDSIIKANYPPSVVERVYDIQSRSPIPAFKQKMFADYYVIRDSVIAQLIKLDTPEEQMDSVKKFWDSTFEAIFAAKEMFDFYTVKKKTTPIPYSQFSLAVRYKTALGLDDAIVNTILQQNQKLRVMKESFYKGNPGKSFDSRAYESETLSNLLTDSQYVKLLAIKNKNKAKTFALQDWRELQVRGMAAGHDRDSTLTELATFYLKRQIAYDRFAHDKLKQSENVNLIYENKPAPLNALIHARRNPANDTQGQSFQW